MPQELPLTSPERDQSRTNPAVLRRADTGDTDAALARLQTVVHELAGVLDGSLRLLDLARGALADRDASEQRAADALRHVDSARAAMNHVADMIRETYRPGRWRLPAASAAAPSIAGAIRHAVDVTAAGIEHKNIQITIAADADLEAAPAASIYTVLVNALRNAVEAIAATGEPGTVHIAATICATNTPADRHVVIDILDDGPGPTPRAIDHAFERGFTTKPGSTGIGLALARDVVNELAGTIELAPRWPDRDSRRGAHLRIRYPLPMTHKSQSTDPARKGRPSC
jgi:signal transduction histidine kinase